MSEVNDRTGASAGCAEVDGEVRERLREAAEAEAAAAAIEQEDWELVTCDAAGLPFGMVGELTESSVRSFWWWCRCLWE